MTVDLRILKALHRGAVKEEIRDQLRGYQKKVMDSDMKDADKARILGRIQELLNIP